MRNSSRFPQPQGEQSISSHPFPPDSFPHRLAVLLLIAFSLLLYITTTGFDFVVDDGLLLSRNPYVLSFSFLKEIFTRDFWAFRGASGETGFYRPLVMVTLLIERVLFGLRPAAYHLVNVILNGLVVVLVYGVGRVLWPAGKGPFWAGLIFAASPLHTENVVPVSGISDLECSLFMLLSVWFHTRSPDSRDRLANRYSALAASMFVLALLCKEVALVLPVLLIFYDCFLRADESPPSRLGLGHAVWFFLPAVLYVAVRFAIFGGLARPAEVHAQGFSGAILSAFGLVGLYLFKLLWPQHLAYSVKFHPPESWWNVYVLLGIVALLLASAAFYRSWRRDRRVSFAILWFFLTLGPALSVRWLGPTAYGERYLYIPSVAFCWLAGEGLARLGRWPSALPRWRLPLAQALPLALAALLTARTILRIPEWRNNQTLAVATLREAPNSAIFHIYLGNGFVQAGNRSLARQEYIAAIASDPFIFQAYLNLAGVLMNEGAVDGARALFRRAAEVNPRAPEVYYAWGVVEMGEGDRHRARQLFERAIALNPSYTDALNNLGVMAFQQGKLDEAQQYLAQADRADPFSVDTHLNLGVVFSRKGDFRRAEAEFRQAMELAPGSAEPYLSLAALYEDQKNVSAALEVYQRGLRVQPNSATLEFRLGVLALKVRDLALATAALERAAKIQPQSGLVHIQLGLAYQAVGKHSEARRELEAGLSLKPDDETAIQALQKVK